MDWTEKQECVLCDKGGNLLVCSGDGCPISVHKSCMGCEANFDDAGNFHCPYCVYKQITAETIRLREKVMLNKKNLSTFLDENVKDDNHQMADKEEEITLKDKLVDQNDLVSDDVPNHDVSLEKQQQSKTHVPCDETRDTLVFEKTDVNSCMIMVIYEPKTNPVDTQLLAKNEEKVQLKDQVLSSSLDKKITRKKRSRLVTSNKNGKRRKEERVTEDLEHVAEMLVSLHNGVKFQLKPNSKIDNDDLTSLLGHPNGATNGSLEAKTNGASTAKTNDVINREEVKDSSKQDSVKDKDRSNILSLLSGKHRVLWSEEEEDMLKEGVQKFSAQARKNLPWKKIFDFGRHVFDPSRNPSDLKDKWRKLAKQN